MLINFENSIQDYNFSIKFHHLNFDLFCFINSNNSVMFLFTWISSVTHNLGPSISMTCDELYVDRILFIFLTRNGIFMSNP